MLRGYRHVYLLGSLLLLVLVRPFLGEELLGLALIDIFLLLTLVASVLACATNRRQAAIGIGLAAAVQVALWLSYFTSGKSLLYAYPGLGMVFFVYITVLMLRDVFLKSSRVSTDTICGALSVYLLMGLIWTFAYAILETAEPNSFSLANTSGLSHTRLDGFMGFSFVTLTTLGYGNIVPLTPRADALATTEAMTGQIYLTVLVARLVAIHVTQGRASRADSPGDE